MELSLKNCYRLLPKDLINKALKTAVRECDEVEKGYFEAYVDEGHLTFDVSIWMAGKNIVVENHKCDCGSALAFCRHKAALLLHLASIKKTKSPKVTRKKTNPTDALLNDVSHQDLVAWVSELLQKNKDIELAFVHHFSPAKNEVSPEDIKKLTEDAFKTVVKNKRNLVATEVKRIADLWKQLHLPVVEHYYHNISNEAAFLNFNKIIQICASIELTISTTSNRITKYLEELFNNAALNLSEVQDEISWQKGVGFFFTQIGDDNYLINLKYLRFFERMVEISPPRRKVILFTGLLKIYDRKKLDNTYTLKFFTISLLEMAIANDLFAANFQLFAPILYENKYNIALIKALIKIGELERAELFCREQIGKNHREEYNIPYRLLIQDIKLLFHKKS